MTRTVAVIQARLGSRRFPEKMLALLGGRSLLEWVVTRVRQSSLVDHVIVATTTEPRDDRLVAECQRLGVVVARGSTDDVLGRVVGALTGDSCDTVVRVCADNPFIDGRCIDEAITTHHNEEVDYTFNHRPHGSCNYADGFGVEVISRRLLEQLHSTPLSLSHREHVTLAVVEGVVSASIHGCLAPPGLARPDMRFDVDLPGDLARLQQLVTSGNLTPESSAIEVLAVADRVNAIKPS